MLSRKLCDFFISLFLILFVLFRVSSQGSPEHQSTNLPDNDRSSFFFYQRPEFPRDCYEVLSQCSTSNSDGVYFIKPEGYPEPFEVYCDNSPDDGGWTVIQRRQKGNSMYFYRTWEAYKHGFGFLSQEHWLGNEKISHITNQMKYKLRIDITSVSGLSYYVTYDSIRISDEYGKYKMVDVGEYNGTAVILSCPTNMKYAECTCQTTCEDPNGDSGCHGTCSGNEGCVCPNGFSFSGTDCIRDNECGCFLTEANMVIPDGRTYVNEECTLHCSCRNNQLNCAAVSCSTHAACIMSNNVWQCVCNEGFRGDGLTCESLYSDCKDVYDAGNRRNGVYTIMPAGWTDAAFRVYCKMDNGGGWTVFQKRTDGTTNFYRSWNEYKQGFGDHVNFNNDFWLGNDKLYYLTNQRRYKLRFDIIRSTGSQYAEYTEFQIQSESANYRMNKLGSHSGNTGNALHHCRGKQFSTRGRDNDACSNFHCAEKHKSGWWHSDHWCSYCDSGFCHRFLKSGSCYTICTDENLNGDYDGGNGQRIHSYYGHVHGNADTICNLQQVEMKIRPSS